ncbi:hypothetical protein BYT27DRAFT_7149586 [Phlegmacium glaucopus]|nr:hypothetical protein BYT27DRAFT_7149586 [Phlegmacium glaucopus]
MSQATTIDEPPPFQAVNVIELDSVTDSTITSVSVYSSRAEITRLFKFNITTGQNQLNVSGLPKVLDPDSLRVEGRGVATIHGVTISTIVPPPCPTSSDTLKELLDKKRRTEKATERAKKSLAALETYLGSLKIEHLDATNLRQVVNNYDTAAEELDNRIAELEDVLAETNEAIEVEKARLSGPVGNANLNLKVSIGVFADFEGEVKIALIYAVQSATWNAGYDIRVDMKAKDKPVTLTYKGGITQNTGEDWKDVPLTLETATPTFGLEVPRLIPWNISIYQQPQLRSLKRGSAFGSIMPGQAPSPSMKRKVGGQSEPSGQPNMQDRFLDVSSTGNVSATFQVPGLISIPSDGIAHNVTIAKLTLDATMSWVCVPKKDTKTHLNAKIKNASPYTFLSGQASVYVDGSFISKSDVPLVSPEESFDCPLGVDPSIRVIYHPRSKKISQSGFYTKTTNYVFSQRITVSNTKTLAIENLKIIDQAPVSEDSDITVKLVSPALGIPGEGFGGGTIGVSGSSIGGIGGEKELKAPPPLRVASGVIAQWHGADEAGVEVEALGKDGKLNWVCAVPAQEKIGLVLQWEVMAPAKTAIVGLPV